MLQKYEILKKIRTAGVLAVVRGKNKNNAYKIAESSIEGGITAIEVAFTTPHANSVIEDLTAKYSTTPKVIVGAGTVLDVATARVAIIAGAKFIVSPAYSSEVAKLCNLYAIPYIPGCFTPSEVQQALLTGSDLIKIFPGSIAGQDIIPEISGPYPYVNVMPSGGVSFKNMHMWFEKGAFAVGIGGSLVGPGLNDDYDQVKENAEQFYNELICIRNSKN